MIDAILTTNIVTGPAIFIVTSIAAVAAAYLLARRPSRRWIVTVLIALGTGAALAVATSFVTVRLLNLFGTGLGLVNYAWLAATFCGTALALVNLRRSRWWRKTIAILCIPLFLVTGTLAINAFYGINLTVGNLLNISTDRPIRLTPSTASSGFDKALWKHWHPPADMPAKGTIGTQVIPNTLSGFTSRPAGIYLPPAALVKNPPKLPLVVMMLGQPGNPVPAFAAYILDAFAAKHKGLAPIVIVADQLGDPMVDPLCLDTPKFGNAETFIIHDVSNWAKNHLNVTHDHHYWTVAGYSNGGQCAISFGVKYPELFANVMDVSGEAFPGAEQAPTVLKDIFHGDLAAYNAVKPTTFMAHNRYPGTTAIFTAGANDPAYTDTALKMTDAARDCGMNAHSYLVPNGGHGQDALVGGMNEGFRVLYPILGLSAPS
ncbi:MAG: alpha/beta hydrolase-fold protein [Leifsonia sp.]